ncbi:MAG: OadG family protein [Lachnospiraceae bacterium]|nr:OadG family protein [Lachnospiraceae bacterium]
MKKLLAILGMVTCMIALSACGAVEEKDEMTAEEQQMLISARETDVDYMHQVLENGMEEQYASNEVVYNGLVSLKNAMDDIGDYVDTSGGTVEVDEKEVVVRINLNGTSHNAVVEMVMNRETAEFENIAVNVDYSLGEKMEKAALNTVLGMGTVFVVLILISLIISAFGLISKAQNSNKKADAPQEKKAENVAPQAAVEEELSDDLELVAVISAAIAAYEGSGSTDGFVVRSIRKARR